MTWHQTLLQLTYENFIFLIIDNIQLLLNNEIRPQECYLVCFDSIRSDDASSCSMCDSDTAITIPLACTKLPSASLYREPMHDCEI